VNSLDRDALEKVLPLLSGHAHSGLKSLLSHYDAGLIITPLDKRRLDLANGSTQVREMFGRRWDDMRITGQA